MAVAPDELAAEVTVAEVNLKAIWDVVSRLRVGKAGYAYVVDAGGRLIAHPDISMVLQNRDLSNTPQVKAARLESDAEARDGVSFTTAEGLAGGQVLAVHAAIPTALAGFHRTAARRSARFASHADLAQRRSDAAGPRVVRAGEYFPGAADGGADTAFAGRRARVGKGELDHRIDIRTGDELEALADEFNHTTAQLQDSQRNLEQKVEARTARAHRVARAADGDGGDSEGHRQFAI